MDSPLSQRRCSHCGAPLAGDVPGQLCLRCLLELGLKSGGDALEEPFPAQPSSPAPVETFDRYRILEKIGEGGCGTVYRAEQLAPVRREVALKVIKLGMDTRAVIARFEAERQALALMDHPHIARVLDAGSTHSGRPFFVMELVRGEPITDYCDRHQLSLRQRLELFVLICHALQHAHQKGIIHRDVKPSNILVVEQDGRAVPKVIDFGVAKATARQRLTDQTIYTAFDQFVGTPAYMSPEQAGLTGEDIDTRSDIYSLGVLLYELFTGRPPFDPGRLRQAAIDEICRIIREEDPAPPSSRVTTLTVAELADTAQRRLSPATRLATQLRGDLDWLVMKALEKERNRRYATASDFAADITRFLAHEPVSAGPPTAGYRLRKFVRRNRAGVISFGAVAVALLAGLTVSTRLYILERQALRRAESRAYISDLNLASRMVAVRVGGLQGTVKLLDSWRSHQPDLRGWEWYYLNGLCHRDRLTILADSNQLWSVTWSPDGQRLATGGAEGEVKIWDAETGRQLQALPGPTGEVKAVVWSPDGQRLAAAGKDRTIIVWDLKKGAHSTLAGHQDAVVCLGWSPDSKTLASGSLDGTVRMWDAASGTAGRTIQAGNPVLALCWNHDGTRLIAAGNNHLFNCWEVNPGRKVWTLPFNAEVNVLAVACSPDGTKLATGGLDNAVNFCDAATGTNLVSFWDNQNPVLSLAWSPDGKFLASATAGDGRVALRDARSGGQVVRDFRGHAGAVRCVAWRPDGARLASASADGTVKIWDATGPDPCIIKLSQPDQVKALAWSPDGSRLAAGGRRTGAWLWDFSGRATPMLLRGGYTDWTWAIAWNSAGTRLAVGGTGGLELWDPLARKELWRATNGLGTINAVAWGPGGETIAAVSSDHKLNLWRTVDGGRLKSLDLPAGGGQSLAWSPDGRELATGVGARIYLWNASTLAEERILSGHSGPIKSLAWNSDGTRLASASEDNSAIVWDVRTGKPVASLLGHAAPVRSIAWSPDGRRLATGSWDLSLKIWDPDTGAEICSFETPGDHVGMIDAVAWSRDGRRLAACDIEGSICILAATPGYPPSTDVRAKINSSSSPDVEAETIRSLQLYCATVEPHAANNADALRRMAWILATSRYPEVRNGRKAVDFARQAAEVTGGSVPGILSILAAAEAESGDFTNAIACQKRALALVSSSEARASMTARLRLYESGQPCRDGRW